MERTCRKVLLALVFLLHQLFNLLKKQFEINIHYDSAGKLLCLLLSIIWILGSTENAIGQTITSTVATGTISACVGTPSSSHSLQKIEVSGQLLTEPYSPIQHGTSYL